MADMTATAATVADMSTRLAALELRIATLEATAASGSQYGRHLWQPYHRRPHRKCWGPMTGMLR